VSSGMGCSKTITFVESLTPVCPCTCLSGDRQKESLCSLLPVTQQTVMDAGGCLVESSVTQPTPDVCHDPLSMMDHGAG